MRKKLEKLSSGYRINRAGDDAAGLAISELMRTQIRGLNQAMKNVNDGIGMTQTGDGALVEVHSMLERMKTLAVESANNTYSTIARENLDSEREQLFEEIDRIAGTSNFGQIPLFDAENKEALYEAAKKDGKLADPSVGFAGSWKVKPPVKSDDITLQIGYSSAEKMDMPRYYLGVEGLALNGMSFLNQTAANAAIPDIDNAIEAVADIRADFGAAQNHMEHTYSNLNIMSENMTSAESRIRDTSMAEEFTEYTKDNITFQTSTSMAAQANSIPQMILNLLK